MAAHRHQSPLGSILDFTLPPVVFRDAASRQRCEALFAALLDRLEAEGDATLSTPFRPIAMIRAMHQFALSQLSKDLFLRCFFESIHVDMAADMEAIDMGSVRSGLVEFAQYLNNNFFGPLKVSATKTPQATPASLSVPNPASDQVLPGSHTRVATLRRDCLVRDKQRCVITRAFSIVEADARFGRDGSDASDDDGVRLSDDVVFDALEVAHILPHALMDMGGDNERSAARRNALAILDMFDYGVRHLIEGPNIDRPTNAVTLTPVHHLSFGAFKTFFEPVHAEPHTYRIQPVSNTPTRLPKQPVTRTLFQSDTIDPPLPRLLAIHAAICRILHRSAAGEYWDSVLREAGDEMAKADGSTSLGLLVSLGLGGWLGGGSVAA